MTRVLVVAGEASGDLHAARMVTALRRLVPELDLFGLGGEELAAAGVELLARSEEISVVGITEVLKILSRAREIFHQLLAECDRRPPQAAVLVDFPDFNLRLAKALAERGIPVVYYVSPQVWAWRRGRVKAIARIVRRMLVLFSFEVDFYRRHGVDVTHVGHPLVDEVPRLPHTWDEEPKPTTFRIALLPGSRRSELEALLPVMLEAGRRLAAEVPVQLRLIRARTLAREWIDEPLRQFGAPVEVVEEGRFRALADCHLALCASGTATLETALLGTPLVVLYRVSFFSALLGRLLVRLPAFSLVNLVLDRKAVPELYQGQASPARVAREALEILRNDEDRERQRRALGEVRERLGEGGASERAAAAVADVLAVRPPPMVEVHP